MSTYRDGMHEWEILFVTDSDADAESELVSEVDAKPLTAEGTTLLHNPGALLVRVYRNRNKELVITFVGKDAKSSPAYKLTSFLHMVQTAASDW